MLEQNTLIVILIILINFFEIKSAEAVIPYYHMPSEEFLKNNGLFFARQAYKLLSLGRLNDGLQLAKLAVSLDRNNEKLWAILAEAQIRNDLLNDALQSIKKGKSLNSEIADFYFVESSIYLQRKKLKNAGKSLEKGLSIQPKNTFALFQLGNIFMMQKDFKKALEIFKKAIEIKNDYWQVINNMGLIYFELNEKLFAEINFKKAISIDRNGETLLALAVTLQNKDPRKSILLAKEALKLNPLFVSSKYREEQLWGDKIQKATQKLLESKDLKEDIEFARIYIK